LSKDGHVNVSPKAPGSAVAVIDPHTVAYADLSGSGAETAAHILENQRMTLLFCNLEAGPPKILRLYGQATVVIKEKVPESLRLKLPKDITSCHGFRAVYVLKVHRISSSCGFSLPIMTYQKTRQILNEFSANKGEEGMWEYGIFKNSFSIDGLPSVGILRNSNQDDKKKDATVIVPKPEGGYIFGELVPPADPRVEQSANILAKAAAGLSGRTSNSESPFFAFRTLWVLLLGAFLGSLLTFYYASLMPTDEEVRELL
jgi:hypothetical protein